MPINTQHSREFLRAFDFKNLFIEELGWNTTKMRLPAAQIDGQHYTLTPIAETGGMIVALCVAPDGNIPPTGVRAKIEKHVTPLAAEHILIYLDGTNTSSLWQWVKREGGKAQARSHSYHRNQPGDSLLQKLAGIAFELDELDDEGHVSIGEVTAKVAHAFDAERVTKRFYDQFQKEHSTFLGFLKGIRDQHERDWYASVMLNRLMFLYFIQRKGFLNGDPGYLRTKLEVCQTHGADRYYRDFLTVLFFRGLACEDGERTKEERYLLGNVPYLNGGIFLPHQIEEANPDISIPDAAFERLFDFFDRYNWHLDDRPLRADNEINPDVLGYIFEKYINQKQMGAYYTKEDITGYICKYTILPFLLDKVGLNVAQALADVEPYIYEAVKTEEYLPTETDREYAARRKRYEQILADFAAGKIATVNDLITYNLDIQAFAEDYLRSGALTVTPTMLRGFYKALRELTVLDPTCGSGAFLFAAMNILEPLYELCLDKMEQVLDKDAFHYQDFKTELERVAQHPNRKYFVFKSIIVNNLYGVDIMDEAVEICKLRLFLKLVAQVDDAARIEPLPDIDFNIRAGNTLVGFATKEEIGHPSGGYRLYDVDDILHKVGEADREMKFFREAQTALSVKAADFRRAKGKLQAKLTSLRDDLDAALMQDYGQSDLAAFRRSHKPFHWYAEFNGVMSNGGFDVIVGNPPYVEYSKVRKEYSLQNYITERAGNLYTFVMERSNRLQKRGGRYGMIVPISSVCSERSTKLRELFITTGASWVSTFDIRPSRLFDVGQRLAIWIHVNGNAPSLSSARFHHWRSEERATLFATLHYVSASVVGSTRYFPKVSSPHFTDILLKLTSSSFSELGNQVAGKRTEDYVFYQESARYWIKAAVGLPYYKKNGAVEAPAHGRTLYFDSADKSRSAFAVISSTLFYLWFVALCDGFHVTDDAVSCFRIPQDLLNSAELAQLGQRLDENQRVSAIRKTMSLRSGTEIEYDEYQSQSSKPIIDEIDQVLAQHYGFTDEELDFIINYDIKYRMGRDAESGNGDEGDE